VARWGSVLHHQHRRLIRVIVSNRDHAQSRCPNGIVSLGCQSGTAVRSVGGSVGVPSSCSSLKMYAIRSSLPLSARTERSSLRLYAEGTYVPSSVHHAGAAAAKQPKELVHAGAAVSHDQEAHGWRYD
jgi:hypothetical protein